MEDFVCAGPYGPLECIIEPYRGPGPCPATFIMCHGFRGSRESGGRAVLVARQLTRYCQVLRFNFTATDLLSKWKEELEAVLLALEERQPGAVFVMGRSLGGACAFVTTAVRPEVAGLILWATPFDLRGTFRFVMGEEDYARLDAGETVHYDDERGVCDVDPAFLPDFDRYDWPSLWQSRSRKMPVLILHCQDDETVLSSQAWQNFAHARANGVPCTFSLFPKGDHSFTEYSETAGRLIAAWLRAHLPAAK